MKIEIITKNVQNHVDTQIREYIERKAHVALDRIDARIEGLTVRLDDETKDSKLFDGTCRVDLTLIPRGHVHVSAKADSAFDCVLQAMEKLEHAVKHEIDKHRRSSSIRHQNGKRDFIETLNTSD